MDLNWSHQLHSMTQKLFDKLQRLEQSYASPKQTLDILRTAVIPSIAYAFPVTPCSQANLEHWDTSVLSTIKKKFGLWSKTCTALLHEDKQNFGLGYTSMTVEYHYRNAVALTTSLNDKSRHGRITNLLLRCQTAHLQNIANGLLGPRCQTPKNLD